MAWNTVAVLLQLASSAVMMCISALFLMLSAKIFKLEDQTYLTALKISAVLYFISFVLGFISILSLSILAYMAILNILVFIALGIFMVKKIYQAEWKETILTWLVWFVTILIVGYMMNVVFRTILGF